jgi:hypothetical protein
MPAKPSVRCGRPAERRRDVKPVCLRCWAELTERKADKDLRNPERN